MKQRSTLYLTKQGAWARKDGDRVEVRLDGEKLTALPLLAIDGIVCFGNVNLTPFLMGACADAGIAISFHTERGRFLARVVGPASGNVLLRREQYRIADTHERAAAIVHSFVAGKLAAMRSNLRRSARDAPADSTRREKLTKGADAIHAILKGLRRDASIDSLRGAEGDASSRYFAAIDAMQRRDPGAFAFEKRTRRPPLNPMNALLSFLYSLLMHDCAAALQSTGLDPAVGFLHSDRPGRLSLALDLMEEFRASLADRLALTLINRKQIIPEGFKTRESGAVEMDDDTRRSVLIAWQERKREALTHPFTNERCTWGLAPFIQSRLLARTIRGDLDAYPPFSVK